MSNWISVEDKLPRVNEDVLMRVTCSSYFNVEQGRYKGGDDWMNCWCSSRNADLYPITHWQPLPSSP